MVKIKKGNSNSADSQAVGEATQTDKLENQPAEKAVSAKGLGRFIKSGLDAVMPRQQEQVIAEFQEADGKPKMGWHSPVYTLSRQVTLNPATLAANRCIINRAPDSVEMDAYRVLRTRILQHCVEKGGNTIMMTSAVPGDGKTLTSINLAVTLAQEFRQTVLLVDCDLRRQSIHHYLGYGSDKGIIDYLLNDTPVSELITWPGIEKLTVISGGRPISGSCELLGSPRMKDLVADMKCRYPDRYVIFDVPPLLAGADALAFVPLVDHVVVTVNEGETSLLDVKKALQLIPSEKVLGLVLNRHKSMSNIVPYSVRRHHLNP